MSVLQKVAAAVLVALLAAVGYGLWTTSPTASPARAQAADADRAAIQDRLDLAQSQLELAQDEVQEADNDLLQAGGNVHQRIQMMQQEHDATERNAAATPVAAAPSRFGSLRGLVGQV